MRQRHEDPGRHLRLGPEGRATTSASSPPTTLKGGRLGGERLVEAMQRQAARSCCCATPKGHDSTGKREDGFLDAMKAHPDRRGRQLESVRRRRRRGRLQDGRGDPQQLQEARRQPRRRRHLLSERVVDVRHAAGAAGQRLGGQGAVRRLRRVREPGQGAARRRTSTASSSRIRSTWAISRVKTMVAHIKGEPVETTDRHRRPRRHARATWNSRR